MSSAESIKDGDYKIQQISRLLESGGTMLAQHCNVCGAPFFRYHGEILCPVCSTLGEQTLATPKEESVSVSRAESKQSSSIAVSEEVAPTISSVNETVSAPEEGDKSEKLVESAASSSKEQVVTPDKSTTASTDFTSTSDPQALGRALLQNLEKVALQMSGESDIQKVTEKLDLVERTLNLAERIKKL
ncbi:UPF0148 protein [Methanohalophilus levihalophilus]|uniref:Sjogren's syndrome/scleroderma autoantigen 1 family protein n=1 Tax=Methanohalophilus levihalophilus TaxID=1431282 RepID=UPI001AE6D6FE|nr:Sjogren's syndrome/scleroderma autoantigen 1 family protein [Methanohalophilus levihalophilus]MBP2031320.1 UPF0148 protein [Methanohalophilus levihalophilus]